MSETVLLASAPSVEAIEQCVSRFYGGEWVWINPETLEIVKNRKGEPWTPTGVRIVRKGKRYRFEMVK